MNEEKMMQLDKNIDILSRMIRACVRIKKGEAQSAVFNELHVNNRMFKLAGMTDDKNISDTPTKDRPANSLPSINAAERLYSAVTGVYDLSEIPTDVEYTVNEALDLLCETERKVLHMRFWDLLSREECGDIMSLSPERIRQIEKKALSRLRHPAFRSYFSFGQTYHDKERVRALEKELDSEKERISELTEELDKLSAKRLSLTALVQKAYLSAFKEYVAENKHKEIPDDASVDVLMLNCRASSCLYNNNIKTIGDLKRLDRKQLSQIRGLGDKSILHIEEEYERNTGEKLFQ